MLVFSNAYVAIHAERIRSNETTLGDNDTKVSLKRLLLIVCTGMCSCFRPVYHIRDHAVLIRGKRVVLMRDFKGHPQTSFDLQVETLQSEGVLKRVQRNSPGLDYWLVFTDKPRGASWVQVLLSACDFANKVRGARFRPHGLKIKLTAPGPT